MLGWFGLQNFGGMVRVSSVHYKMGQEIKRFGEVLGKIAAPLGFTAGKEQLNPNEEVDGE